MNSRKKTWFIVIGLCIFLAGCTGHVTKDDLIGSTWTPEGYDDIKEELSDKGSCPLIQGDMTFLDDKKIHVEDEEYDMEYILNHKDDRTELKTFHPTWGLDYYYLQALSENEVILYDGDYRNTCLLTREGKDD